MMARHVLTALFIAALPMIVPSCTSDEGGAGARGSGAEVSCDWHFEECFSTKRLIVGLMASESGLDDGLFGRNLAKLKIEMGPDTLEGPWGGFCDLGPELAEVGLVASHVQDRFCGDESTEARLTVTTPDGRVGTKTVQLVPTNCCGVDIAYQVVLIGKSGNPVFLDTRYVTPCLMPGAHPADGWGRLHHGPMDCE